MDAGERMGQTPTAEPSDAELILRVREGDVDAYSLLYTRHLAAATRVARYQTSGTRIAAEDAVAEGFANVLTAIQAGRGPTESFRAYLYTAIRNGVTAQRERDARSVTVDDMGRYEEVEAFVDPVVSAFESSVVQTAFAGLPERWQAALWYHEVEGMKPAAIAPLLGVSPNGVSALLLRAKEGLRERFLIAHLAAVDGARDECRWTAERLGARARGTLARRERRRLEAHLEVCADCSAMAFEVADVSRGLRLVVAPLVLGGAGAEWLLASATQQAGQAAPTALGIRRPRLSRMTTAAAGGTAAAVVVAAAAVALPALLADPGPGAVPPPDDAPVVAEPPVTPDPIATDEPVSVVPDPVEPLVPPRTPPRVVPPPPGPGPGPGPDPGPGGGPGWSQMTQSLILGGFTVVDRDHPALVLDGTVASATVTWVASAVDIIIFDTPIGQYTFPPETVTQIADAAGDPLYLMTADVTSPVFAAGDGIWDAVSLGTVTWRIEVATTGGSATSGVLLDGPLVLGAGQDAWIALLLPGDGTVYLTTADGAPLTATVTGGVLRIHADAATVLLRAIVIMTP